MCLKNLQKVAQKNYGLCSCHHLSTRALSWNTMLNIKKVEFDLVLNAEFYFFVEKGIKVEVPHFYNI